MPLFTSANAREMSRRGNLARWSRPRVPSNSPDFPPRVADESQEKRERISKQIDRCDVMLQSCKDPDVFVKLVQAKARLWELLYPKPGSLRPRSGRGRMSQPTFEPSFEPAPAPAPEPVQQPT